MDTNNKTSIKEIVAHLIQKFRTLLIVFLVIIGIGIVAVIVLQETSKVTLSSVTLVVEQLETAYETLTSTTDSAEKAVAQKAFDDVVSKIEQSFKGSYAQQRADFFQGNLKFTAKDFAASETFFQKAAQDLKNSYLAPIALMNAAISAEEAGDLAKARSTLSSLAINYVKVSPLSIRALFNLGRISEIEKNYKEAQDSYQKIISDHASSSWTKLARDRIIYLKAQSLL